MKGLLISFLILANTVGAQQKLKAGFDQDELIEVIKISSWQLDSMYNPKFPKPERFKLEYRSKYMGLDNRWDLWLSEDSVGVISIRQSTKKQSNLFENAYAAMVPATGRLKISNNFTFNYALTPDSNAAVHTGWLLGTAFLSKDILTKLEEYRLKGIKEYIIAGHSLGGAVATLLTAHLKSLQEREQLSNEFKFKTYCSAAPKPGNLNFAYHYEKVTKGGWAFNVVNPADWTLEAPFTIQAISDLNVINPFVYAKTNKKNMKLKDRLLMNYLTNKISKPTRSAQKKYQRLLGKTVSKYIRKYLPEFEPPTYFPSMHYVRTGTQIILEPNGKYFSIFKSNPNNMWTHHSFEAYLYLARAYKLD